jgi:hypothetical protein
MWLYFKKLRERFSSASGKNHGLSFENACYQFYPHTRQEFNNLNYKKLSITPILTLGILVLEDEVKEIASF